MQEKTLRNIFNAFLKPYLEYGTLVWSEAPKTYLEKLTKHWIDPLEPFCLNRSMTL